MVPRLRAVAAMRRIQPGKIIGEGTPRGYGALKVSCSDTRSVQLCEMVVLPTGETGMVNGIDHRDKHLSIIQPGAWDAYAETH